MSLGYQLTHLLHLLFGAAWVGVALASDYLTATLEQSSDRVDRAMTVRQLLVRVEMPLATLVPLIGLTLSAFHPGIFMAPWFHVKLTAVVLLLLFSSFAVIRNRRLIRALEAGDDARAGKEWHGYLAMRIVAWIAFVAIFVAVVFRFGVPTPY
jgi:uncharacterized membrane protein